MNRDDLPSGRAVALLLMLAALAGFVIGWTTADICWLGDHYGSCF